jgi:homocysteine S-methyltransferase
MVLSDRFTVIVTVVPPAGPDPDPLLTRLAALEQRPFDAFSVASNPMAKPRMSALVFSHLLRQRVSKPVIWHCTMRDFNALSVDSELWGARALGIETALVTTGDTVALRQRTQAQTAQDMSVFDLIRKARAIGFRTGVVLDPGADASGLVQSVRHLKWKERAGAQFVITQPAYDETGVETLAEVAQQVDLPLLMGILPLRSTEHATFLDRWVSGIVVPEAVRQRLAQADDPAAEGLANAREMLDIARERFAGACLMPPFGRYEMPGEIIV